jgi:hypothetical protein
MPYVRWKPLRYLIAIDRLSLRLCLTVSAYFASTVAIAVAVLAAFALLPIAFIAFGLYLRVTLLVVIVAGLAGLWTNRRRAGASRVG